MTPMLTVDDLCVRFPTRTCVIEAVRGISFTVGRERLGIVGEIRIGQIADRPRYHGTDAP